MALAAFCCLHRICETFLHRERRETNFALLLVFTRHFYSSVSQDFGRNSVKKYHQYLPDIFILVFLRIFEILQTKYCLSRKQNYRNQGYYSLKQNIGKCRKSVECVSDCSSMRLTILILIAAIDRTKPLLLFPEIYTTNSQRLSLHYRLKSVMNPL